MDYIIFIDKNLPKNITAGKKYQVLRKWDFNVAILNDIWEEDYFRFWWPNPVIKFI